MNRMLKFATLATLCSFGAAMAQPTNYSGWDTAGRPSLPTNPANTVAAPLGGLTTYANLAAFQAAAPVTAAEDFEGGLVAGGAVITCTEPVNSNSNDACFTPGNLVAGFNVSSSLGGGVVVLGAGIIGQADVVIGANSFPESTNVSFDAIDIDAIAFDLYSNGANPVTITAFDSGGATIGTINTAVSAVGAPIFVGFTSASPIASINISDDTAGGELLDNLLFGMAGPPPPPMPVPTITLTGLVVLLLAISGFAFYFRRRRTQR